METTYDVIIIGAGPAGLTAGLYTSRARLRTLILEKETIGGELMNRDLIENYPGYPDGVQGPTLGSNMTTQVMNLGTKIRFDEVKQIVIEGTENVVEASQENYLGKVIILAGGAHPRKLGVPGEEQLAGKGVFYCATCDGPSFANKVVAVAGGGNSGITEALFLARFVSRVIVVEVQPYLTADKILQERLLSKPKIEVKCGHGIKAIRGDEHVKSLEVVDIKTGQESVLGVDGILVHIGLEANTNYLVGAVPFDEKGQVLVNEVMETTVPGVFAAGDIRHNSPMQIATAVGDGAIAALSAEKYIARL